MWLRKFPFAAEQLPEAQRHPGIESIWKKQITDAKGFEKIYVAAMRACGVPARLDTQGKAEFHTGTEWKPAPASVGLDFSQALPIPN